MARLCGQHRVPMIAFGRGSSAEGQVLATAGGITISLARMNRILATRVEHLDATVEAGVTRLRLNAALTVMTVEIPRMMKVMTVSLIPDPSPARGRREIRESLTRLSHCRVSRQPGVGRRTGRGGAGDRRQPRRPGFRLGHSHRRPRAPVAGPSSRPLRLPAAQARMSGVSDRCPRTDSMVTRRWQSCVRSSWRWIPTTCSTRARCCRPPDTQKSPAGEATDPPANGHSRDGADPAPAQPRLPTADQKAANPAGGGKKKGRHHG